MHRRTLQGAGSGWLWQPEVTASEGADAGLAMLAEAFEADQDAVGVNGKHLGGDARVAHPARALLRRHHTPLHQLHSPQAHLTMPPLTEPKL